MFGLLNSSPLLPPHPNHVLIPFLIFSYLSAVLWGSGTDNNPLHSLSHPLTPPHSALSLPLYTCTSKLSLRPTTPSHTPYAVLHRHSTPYALLRRPLLPIRPTPPSPTPYALLHRPLLPTPCYTVLSDSRSFSQLPTLSTLPHTSPTPRTPTQLFPPSSFSNQRTHSPESPHKPLSHKHYQLHPYYPFPRALLTLSFLCLCLVRRG